MVRKTRELGKYIAQENFYRSGPVREPSFFSSSIEMDLIYYNPCGQNAPDKKVAKKAAPKEFTKAKKTQSALQRDYLPRELGSTTKA